MSPTIRYAKPALLTSLTAGKHAVIEASAGTGKTYTLEHLYIDLLLRGATVEQILVVTFTEKATVELRLRVRAKLEELVAAGPDRDASHLPEERTWLLDDAARARLLGALQSFDAATIATIHAFCQRLLTEHAFANRQLFTLEQVDRRQSFSVAFKEALREEFARDEQRQQRYLRAALAQGYDVEGLEELLYACLVAPGRLEPVHDEHSLINALEAAPLALFEDEDALKASFKQARIHGSTSKAVVTRLGALARLITRFLDHRDPARYLQEHEDDGAPLAYVAASLAGHDLDDVGEKVRRSIDALAPRSVPLRAALAHEFLPRVRHRLDRRKRELGHYDFDDMLTLVRDSLAGPGGESLASALRRRYRHALIDEFQDTDETQWNIFRRLFFDGPTTMFLIGDPKQAIYGFRGADVHTYLRARDELIAAGADRLALDHNFRSTPELIDAYNLLLDQRAARPHFTGAIRYEEPVRAGDAAQRALDSEGQLLAPVSVLTLEPTDTRHPLRRLGRRIAVEIKRLLDPDAPALVWERGGTGRTLGLRDIFILTFSRREGLIIAESLRDAGITHSFYKQDGLFQTEEAQHLLDLLEAVDDPHLPARRLRAWLTPFFDLPLEQAHRCRELPADHPLVARLHDLHALARDKRYERLFSSLLIETGLLRRVLVAGGERQLTNYLHLFELLLDEVGRARCSLRELTATLRAWVDERRMPPGDNPGVQRLESDQPAVQIMTMHKAKGLEAPVVFVAGGLVRPRFQSLVRTFHLGGERIGHLGEPASEAMKAAIVAERRHEDERLMYVALTRARARLYLPHVPINPDPKAKKGLVADGVYACVNERLDTLRMQPGGAGHLFHFDEADGLPPPSTVEAPPVSLPAWATPEDAFVPRDLEAEMNALRRARGGRSVTSYTALQRGHAHGEEPREADQTGEVAAEVERRDDDLPGGAASGIFLHAVIEHLDLGSLVESPDFSAWRARPDVRDVVAKQAALHSIDARYLPHSERMIFASLSGATTLCTPLPGLAHTARRLCEVEFLFPLPSSSTLGRQPLDEDARIHADEGYAKGYIDFLFEHDGRLYFADWKSDGLRSWSPAALAAHVQRSYPRQLQLYSLALVRMLGVTTEADYEARFGGVLYVFLRAAESGQGFHFWRPDWQQILAWEHDLTRLARRATG